jgi:hypothetical protein
MASVAILGAGPVGAAIAHRLAERARVHTIRLLDAEASVAAGKALDLQQTCPIDGADTTLSGSADLLSASGAGVIVVADRVNGGEWRGEEGLALVRQLERAGTTAPFVFAGGDQTWLMETAHRELNVPAARLVGTAGSGLVSAVRAIAAAELGETGVELTIAGRPPAFVIAWSAAMSGGSLLTERVPAHRLLAISQSLRRLWPPGPQTIAAPTADVIVALLEGSRRLLPAMTILDGELGARRVAGMLPLELGRGRVLRKVIPTLSPQERTELMTSLSK